MLALEFFRTEITQCGVAALAVVPDFDPGEDRISGLLHILKAGSIDHLFLGLGQIVGGTSQNIRF